MTSQPDMQGLDPKALEAAPDQHAMFCVIEEHLHLFPHMLKNDGIHTLHRIVGTYLASLPQQTAEPVAPELDARLRSLATTLEAYGLDYMQAHHVIEKVRALASSERSGREAVIEELAAALKPFADEADRIHPDWADERRRVTLTPSRELTVGDFRRARAAIRNLAGTKTNE